jgi:hypothetical protein
MTPDELAASENSPMEIPACAAVVDQFSLVIGGPFYDMLRRMKLVEPAPNVRRRIAIFILITWLPLALLSALQGTLFGNNVRLPLLYDFSIYGRFFVGLPLFIIAEIMIDPWIRRVVRTFAKSGIVRAAEIPKYHSLLLKILRLRDSALAETVVLLVASLPLYLLDDQEWFSQGLTTWHGTASGGFSWAGWWFVFISSPVVRFLLLRWLWRYFLWGLLLFRVMELDLNLMPTHPDLLGGLGFVLNAQQHFGILFAALAGFLAGQYGNSIMYFGLNISATKAPMAVFVLMAVVVVLAPLLLLTPKLIDLRREALSRYSQTARNLGEAFDTKWTRNVYAGGESMLGSTDPSSLIDYVSSYQVVRDLKVFPIRKQFVLQVAAQAGAPLGIVWIAATPVEKIIAGVLKLLV